MRIKAQVVNKAPIYEMANGASESIGSIQANTLITLVRSKKDGIDTYYQMDEYTGYIKKNFIKIIRDEDFFYTSSLLRKKQNRSNNNRFNQMRQSIAANSSNTSVRPSQSKKAPNTNTANNGASNKPDSGDGLVKQYNQTTVSEAQSNSTNKPSVGRVIATTVAAVAIGSLLSNRNRNTGMYHGGMMSGGGFGGGIGGMNTGGMYGGFGGMNTGGMYRGGMMSGGGFGGGIGGMNTGGMIGGNMIGGMMSGGGFGGGIGGMNAGGLLGGIIGGALSGANVGDMLVGALMMSAMSTINNILGSLFQKLDYIVGFNLSGTLASYIGGFSSTNNILKYLNGTNGNNSTLPSILTQTGNADNKIREYFKYKGSSVSLSGRAPTNLAGGAIYGPIDYTTKAPSLSGEKKEYIEVHRNIYNNLYADFADSLKSVRSSVNLNMTSNDWFYNFNRFRLVHPDSILATSKGYVFFTRPDLNIVSSSVATSDIGMLMYNISTFYPGIISGLQLNPQTSNAKFDNGHKFIPLLCNRCSGIDINDETLETKEVGDTYTGWKLNYGTTTIKSKTANSVTTSFFDDERLSIYLTFKLWEEYINGVSRGIILPKDVYIKTKQLDYAISIYYFLCAEDGESIIFWTKFTGCIPTNIPSSNFTDNLESPIKQPKYSITWQYAFKKDYDPYSLAEFNHLSDSGSNGQAVKIYDEETFRSVRTLSGAPFVDTNTGGRLFKLRFRAAQNSFDSEYK